LIDGHVHITNRIFWERIDAWQPQATGWDYARAAGAGVNVIIENVAPYGYWSYNQTPKQVLRLIETFYRFLEANQDKMGLALTAADARSIASSGRVAVFLGVESGFDHEGDPDVLGALYRLGVRFVQFSTQTGFNALCDVTANFPGGADMHWGGLSDRGRALVREMNRLGVLIDITHASEAAQMQLIEASEAPVTASHLYASSVSGPGGLTDQLIEALAAKGGILGIHGAGNSISRRYREWVAKNPGKAAALGKATSDNVGYRPSFARTPDDSNYGDFSVRMDQEVRHRALNVWAPWSDDPEAVPLAPTADEWAEHVDHVINLVGPNHVGIGLDITGSRSTIPSDGYPQLVEAITRITTPENARLVAGENWMRVIEATIG
jgi:membrane dipeptidase